MSQNRYGLSRTISEDIARQVRQRDGFGCIICGSAFYQYDHFDPEFNEAEEHRLDGICLLCIGCHGQKTKKMLSLETIRTALANPKCRQTGFSWGLFDVGTEHPEIVLGTFTAKEVKVLIRIGEDDIFSILPPEIPGGPFRMNARLYNSDGTPVLEIVENEWRTSSENWDVEQVGQRLTLRRGLGDIVLSLRSEPPHRLVVERLDMQHKGVTISAREGQGTTIKTRGGVRFTTRDFQGEGCSVGIQIDESSFLVGVGCRSAKLFRTSIQSVPSPFPYMSTAPRKNLRRNAPCWCDSGRKFKHCHGAFHAFGAVFMDGNNTNR